MRQPIYAGVWTSIIATDSGRSGPEKVWHCLSGWMSINTFQSNQKYPLLLPGEYRGLSLEISPALQLDTSQPSHIGI